MMMMIVKDADYDYRTILIILIQIMQYKKGLTSRRYLYFQISAVWDGIW